jgi:hypothetical protein
MLPDFLVLFGPGYISFGEKGSIVNTKTQLEYKPFMDSYFI